MSDEGLAIGHKSWHSFRSSLILLLFLIACTPQVQSYRNVTDAPVQPISDHRMVAADGVALPMRSWLPKGRPKAVIIALHGFNDYSNGFQGTGEFMRQRGIAVYAYDQRGFGKTSHTGIWAGEDNLAADLKQALREAKARYPHTPLYVLGESMGGAVAIVALEDKDAPPVDGLILEAPAVWGAETMNPLFRATLWVGAHIMPGKKLTGRELKILATNNIPMLRLMAADPLVLKKTRIDAAYGIVQLMDSAWDQIPAITPPTLLLYGGHDQVIPREAIESAAGRFTAPLQVAYYPEGYHMLTRDLEGKVVMGDIVSWIEHPNRPLPSGVGALLKYSAN